MARRTLNRPPSLLTADTPTPTPPRPARRFGSLIGSALLVTADTKPPKVTREVTDWQSEAWEMYDRVSELRAGAGWKSNAMSRLNLTIARVPDSTGTEPVPADPEDAEAQRWFDLLEDFGGGAAGHGQILADASLQLEIAGEGWILGTIDVESDTFTSWDVLSTEEVTVSAAGGVKVKDQETGDDRELGDDMLIRVWRSHPRRGWEPDAPTRALLPALRVLSALTSRSSVEARSRLLGNGILWMPSEIEMPDGWTPGDVDPFLQDLINIARLAVADPESVAAGIPIVSRVPAELIKEIKHSSFWSDLDDRVKDLTDAAIRRLSLGMDIPPEILLGMSDLNHWSAWLLDESAIKFHIEPPAELLCHAITTKYLRPAAEEAGIPEPEKWMVWYSTDALRSLPDLSPSASEAHSRGVITDEAYLRVLGLSNEDMPDDADRNRAKISRMVENAPSLAPLLLPLTGLVPEDWTPAADVTVDEIVTEPADDTIEPVDQPPDRDTSQPDRSAQTAALVAACDGIVYRALEVAGRRLGAAASKGKKGGAATIDSSSPTTLHTTLHATEFASIEHLLGGAWDRVPEIADRVGVDAASLEVTLDRYAAQLIAAGVAHDYDLLIAALEA